MKLSKPLKQLAFEDFFNVTPDYSHTLEFFDFCGAFVQSIGPAIKSAKLPVIREPFSHRGKEYVREIRPASLIDDEGESMMYFPSKREELVMHALRYLAAQQAIETGVAEPSNSVTVTFTLHQLRKELKARGHGYNWTELDEALQILSTATLQISYGKKRTDRWTAPYLYSLMSRDAAGVGASSMRSATLHPLASLAINNIATRPLNYGRMMRFKNPLARWLHNRLTHFCTNASHWKVSHAMDNSAPIGMRITLKEIFEQYGLPEASRRSNNYQVVRKALAELVKLGVLHDNAEPPGIGEPYTENLKTAEGEMWTLYPSREVVSEIIEANKRGTRPQDRLGNIEDEDKQEET